MQTEQHDNPSGTVVLTRQDVSRLLDLDTCIAAVEHAFHLHGEGRAADPAVMGVEVATGGFHVKAGVLELRKPYFAAKTNANFPSNRQLFGLPTIQGTIVLHDAVRGYPLAIMDSIEISILRTGAATAVAAKYLARPDSSVVAIAGCGEQGHVQLRALSRVCTLTKALVWDIDSLRSESLADQLTGELGIDVEPVDDMGLAASKADICVTCTPSQDYILSLSDVRPGTFVAGVGVDNPHKRELSPDLLAASRVVVDVLEQSIAIGDLHHAIDAGVMTVEQVHAELSAVVAGESVGRATLEEIMVFDSTGMALQDVAAAAVVYERALAAGVGQYVDFQS